MAPVTRNLLRPTSVIVQQVLVVYLAVLLIKKCPQHVLMSYLDNLFVPTIVNFNGTHVLLCYIWAHLIRTDGNVSI